MISLARISAACIALTLSLSMCLPAAAQFVVPNGSTITSSGSVITITPPSPTPVPTVAPTVAPTPVPTPTATAKPTAKPTVKPTTAPTAVPTPISFLWTPIPNPAITPNPTYVVTPPPVSVPVTTINSFISEMPTSDQWVGNPGVDYDCAKQPDVVETDCKALVGSNIQVTTNGLPFAVGTYFTATGQLTSTGMFYASTLTLLATPAAGSSIIGVCGPDALNPTCPVTAASPAPSPTASVASTGTFQNFPNAQDWMPPFTPWAATSVWNTPISANPTIDPNSAKWVANQFSLSGDGDGFIERATEAGVGDYAHPRFFAKASDPTVTTSCFLYCGAPDNGGVPVTIHIPAAACPAGGSDAHLDVVQPNGIDITMWGVQPPCGAWTNGATVTAANIANCGSFTGASGQLVVGPGPTAMDSCTNAGQITAQELISGVIPHALVFVGQCAVGSQFPAPPGSSTDGCTSGVGPPLGGRFRYNVPCATTQASTTLHIWEKAILCAMNVFGGFLGDDTSGAPIMTGFGSFEVESEEPWRDFTGTGPQKSSYTSPFAPLAADGWTSATIPNVIGNNSGTRWFGADPWHVWESLNETEAQFASHIQWLAACSAQGTC